MSFTDAKKDINWSKKFSRKENESEYMKMFGRIYGPWIIKMFLQYIQKFKPDFPNTPLQNGVRHNCKNFYSFFLLLIS